MTPQEQVLAVAAAQIGVKESPAGSNNVIYNTHYYGQAVHDGLWGTKFPWCAAFVWDVFRMAGLSQLYYGGNKTASCSTLCRFHQQRGQGVPFDRARPGDIVFFSFSGGKSAEHVGLVERVKDGVLTTIEGNTSLTSNDNGGAVMRRSRKRNVVLAVIRPAYEAMEKEEVGMTNDEVKALVAGEVARVVETALNGAKGKVYNTVEDCPAWSGRAVQWAVDSGYIKGDEQGRLGLDDTKVWALQVTYNVLEGAKGHA